ncbi:MAG TPA: xanthine dehydrogenase family protein subunit M [Thermomicrobiales bacterium]|nr:xanthine dehydrogenase family protein subunit M [Thermomicrobiales bacterium]
MFPTEFAYHRASSVQDAIAFLGANPDAKVLAGGHSLIPAMKLRLAMPGALVDLGRIDALREIAVGPAGAKIGAMATYNEIRDNDAIARAYPILPEAIANVGDAQVRERGTFGGSLAHADPAADLTAVFLALDGEVAVTGPNGDRTIGADDFFVDLWTTTLEPEEIITSVNRPAPPAKNGMGYEKHAHPASGYAVVGIAVVLGFGDGGNCDSARVAVTGATSKATRLTGVEDALTGQKLTPELIASAAANAADGLEINGDLYASEKYRAHLVNVMTRRALTRAAGV